MVTLVAETSKVHAAATRVWRLRAMTTSLPPMLDRTSGVTDTSCGVHGPLGWASGVGLTVCSFFGVLLPFGRITVGPVDPGVTDGVRVAAACTAPGSDGPESLPSLPPTSTRPTAKTSRNAVPSTASRRVQ